MASTHWVVNGRFLTQSLTGVQRYAREIVSAIDARLAREERSRDITIELLAPETAVDIPSLRKIRVTRMRGLRGHAFDQVSLPLRQTSRTLNLCNSGPIAGNDHIVCIHDLNTRLAPESYGLGFRAVYRWLVPVVARRAGRVFTVSRFSADALAAANIVDRDAIVVAPNGHEHALEWNGDRSTLAPLPRPYVFLLGSLAAHKNIGTVLASAEALDDLGLDVVIAGGSDQIFNAYPLARRENVKWLGRVSDDDLARLFRDALCFAFPSLLEGFGTPVLEAMTHGCPVVCSSAASLPEVAGDAAIYASPHDVTAWLESIKRLQGDAPMRESLRQRGQQRAKRFSWSDSADLYVDEMRRLSGVPPS